MVLMNDLEWPMLSYYVIYGEKFRKIMQRTEEEALYHHCMIPLSHQLPILTLFATVWIGYTANEAC